MSTQNVSEPVSAPTSRFGGITLWHLSLVLVVIGLTVSGYLSYVKLVDTPMVCVQGSVFNCDFVTNSIYSRMFGIPIAWLGFGMYIVVGLLLLLQYRTAFLREYGMLLLFGVVMFAWMYSMYLVYVQFFLLRALCIWCLTHEANITVLFIVTSLRLRNHLNAAE